MGLKMHHGPRLWSKNCAVTRTKMLQKTAQQIAKRAAHSSQGRGGQCGWGGVPTLVSRCGWEGQRIHGKVAVGR